LDKRTALEYEYEIAALLFSRPETRAWAKKTLKK